MVVGARHDDRIVIGRLIAIERLAHCRLVGDEEPPVLADLRIEPWLYGVMPPAVKVGLTWTGAVHVTPPSLDDETTMGEPDGPNCVHETYTVPLCRSTPTHSLSLKMSVARGFPVASTPSE